METQDSLRTKYNPEGSELRRLQMRMLNILLEIDRVCANNNIQYWLSDGTLLGAVRHGGFIPWDDDIDIQMMEGDYKKFLNSASLELPSNLVVQTHETDDNYYFTYAKIRDTDSFIIEDGISDKNFKFRGIYIDIFPMTHSSPKLLKFSMYWHWYLVIKLSFSVKNSITKKICHLLYQFSNYIYLFFKWLDSKIKNKKINYYYGCQFILNCSPDIIFPLSKLKFEGHSFFVPNNTDSYLRILYGDYWKLPEESQRQHHTSSVTFLL